MAHEHHEARLRNPLETARGLGSAKEGTHTSVVQRLTAIALILLSLLRSSLWWSSLIGADYATCARAVAKPLNAALLVAFLIALFWHVQAGPAGGDRGLRPHAWLASRHAARGHLRLRPRARIASVVAIVRIALGA